MIIQLDPKTRISGDSIDWRVEKLTNGKNGEKWEGKNFFPSLEHALQFAFDKKLAKSNRITATLDDYVDELSRCKGEILAAMRAMAL